MKRRKLAGIKLPPMQCDDHCGECCGPVLVTKKEFDRVVVHAKSCGVFPHQQGCRCPWFQCGRCAVYSARPLICRLFGHLDVPEMTCCRGYNVDVSSKVAKRFLKQCGSPTMVLHQVFSDWEEILRVGLGMAPGAKIQLNPGKHCTGIPAASRGEAISNILRSE